VGQAWHDYVRQIPPEPNLFVMDLSAAAGSTLHESCTGSAMLRVSVANNGNAGPGSPINVTFYGDEGLTEPIGTVAVSAPAGCASEAVVAELVWEGVCAGTNAFWVEVTSHGGLTERTLQDNVAAGSVVVEELPSVQTFMPVFLRSTIQ
jgi:hypothetical protein